MYIVISPSKTMSMNKQNHLKPTSPMYKEKTDEIVKYLQTFSKKELQQKMSLSDKLIEEVFPSIQQFEDSIKGQAIHSYKGFVFQKLAFNEYSNKEYLYMEKHIRILDALYGLLKPSTLIKQYRLDFQMKFDQDFYKYWDFSDYFDDTIINLASNEYSKLLKNHQFITISFLQNKHNHLKNIPTHTKQARGLMLNYLILNQIKEVDQIKKFTVDGYKFQEDLSSAQELVFTR